MLVTLGSFPIACGLLITVLVMGVCAENCEIGWFGVNCTYQCFCPEGCSSEDALCTLCSKGFFGPGCQYVDAAYWDAAQTNPAYLHRDSGICNPSSVAKSVKFTFSKRVRLSWFRMTVNDASVLNQFQVKLNDLSNACIKERRYNKSNTIVDVTCDTTILINFLTIEGAVAPNVCAIYVSTGRNVAVRQRAEQSSTKLPADVNDAKNAVDGNANPNNNQGHCSQTEARLEEPEWNVTFAHPSILYRVQIKSSNFDPEISAGFTVITYNSSGRIVERISSPEEHDARPVHYDLDLHSSMPVTTLTIRGSYGTSLSLCEVAVLGDYVCPDLRYGLSCVKKCHCEGYQLCSPIFGKCTAGCPTGHYGFGCIEACNASCGNDACLQVSGNCYLCRAGRKGEKCTVDCTAKTFGRSCEQKCSPHCTDDCDIIDGGCTCATGYKQQGCLECDQGTFGINCAHNCSSQCLDYKCHHVTGACLACSGNRFGAECEVCPSGKYGENCSMNCSEFCVGGKCDSVKGYCLHCTTGRIGARCTECPVNRYGHSCNSSCPQNCESGLCHIKTGLCLACANNYVGPTCSIEC